MSENLIEVYKKNLKQVCTPARGDLELTIQGELSRNTYYFRGDYNHAVSMYWQAMEDPKVIHVGFIDPLHAP